jgi:hypothetical protein
MTSSFTEIFDTSALLLAALLLAGTGCERVNTDETSATFTRISAPCTGESGAGNGGGNNNGNGWNGTGSTTPGTPPSMDTYIIQSFELLNPTNLAQDPSDCEKCVSNPGACRLEKEICLCGTATPTDPTQLRSLLVGTRIDNIDYDSLYCLQVLAIETDDLRSAQPATCACDPSWTTPAVLSQEARLCAISAPRGTGALDFRLAVQCRSDDTAFTDCLGTTM